MNYQADLISGHTYHVFNRTNGGEKLFHSDNDRKLFFEQYTKFIAPFVDTYCYCLLSNHFHLLLRIKTLEDIKNKIQTTLKKERTISQTRFLESNDIDEADTQIILLHKQFSNFFTSYAMRFNQKHQRTGNLFNRPFKRVAVKDESHFANLVFYIHNNPVHHDLLADFKQHAWSSYHSFLSKKESLLCREEVIEWFGGLENFIEFHNRDEDISMSSPYFLE